MIEAECELKQCCLGLQTGNTSRMDLCFNHMAPSCLSQGVVLGAHPDTTVVMLNFILSELGNQKGF